MDPDRAHQLLTRERARIERSLAQLRQADTAEPNDYVDSAANLAAELYQEELDEGLTDDLHRQLAAVERAEHRLTAGRYGLSIQSGRPIPDDRLEAVPTAERTVDEEANSRRHGSGPSFKALETEASVGEPQRVPSRFRLVLRQPCGTTESGAIRRLQPDSPRAGHTLTTLTAEGPASWTVVEERVERDERGVSFLAVYAERNYGEQDGSLPDHELEHELLRRGSEGWPLARIDKVVAVGLSAELVSLDPGGTPDWEKAERYLEALTLDTLGDDLLERFVDTRRDPQDRWLDTVKERLRADLASFRVDVDDEHDEIEEWEIAGRRIFVSIGDAEAESDPSRGHGWLVRLCDVGVLSAAGFTRIRQAELLL
jgi:DnaK suppressor protein